MQKALQKLQCVCRCVVGLARFVLGIQSRAHFICNSGSNKFHFVIAVSSLLHCAIVASFFFPLHCNTRGSWYYTPAFVGPRKKSP